MEIRVRREDDAPLHSQIALELRQQIESGALGPGARLPSSRELAAQLGVNRTTVVQAFRELQSAGLIESGVGRGSFVAPASPRTPGDAESSAADHSTARNAWRRALGDHAPPSLAPAPAPADLEGEPPSASRERSHRPSCSPSTSCASNSTPLSINSARVRSTTRPPPATSRCAKRSLASWSAPVSTCRSARCW